MLKGPAASPARLWDAEGQAWPRMLLVHPTPAAQEAGGLLGKSHSQTKAVPRRYRPGCCRLGTSGGLQHRQAGILALQGLLVRTWHIPAPSPWQSGSLRPLAQLLPVLRPGRFLQSLGLEGGLNQPRPNLVFYLQFRGASRPPRSRSPGTGGCPSGRCAW